MKIFISLFTLCNSGLLLFAQSAGQSGGTVPAGQQPAQSIPAQTIPAQTSPVQTPPGQSTSVGGQIPGGGFGGRLGTVQGVAPGTATPTRPTDPGVTGGEPVLGQTPSGVDILNPILPPPTNVLPPPIRSGLESTPPRTEVIDPSGASDRSTAQGLEESERGASPTGEVIPESENGAFSQQFQSLPAGDGTTQIAFPRENTVVTIVSRNGNLILQGSVSSEDDRANVEQTIRQISSAGFIDNQLRVIPGSNSNVD